MTIFAARPSKAVIKVQWGHVGGPLSNRISILLRRDTTWEQKKSYVRVLGGGGLKERTHQEANQLAPWSWISQPLVLQEINFCCLNRSLRFYCGSLSGLRYHIFHLVYQESSACCLWWVSVSYVHVKRLIKEGIGCCWPPFRSNPCQSNSSPLHTPVRSWTCKVEVYQTHSRWLSFNSW